MPKNNNTVPMLPEDSKGIESLETEVEKMPKRFEVEDIENISGDILDELKCGDIVAKKTGDQKHSYHVSYKEEGKGICLTYDDATTVETVSYDCVDGVWEYNSTDKGDIPAHA